MTSQAGFLVVLVDPRESSPNLPELYRGIDRVPTYAMGEPVSQALDDYVFGEIVDENTGLIPSLHAAVSLRRELSKDGKDYEIIYCSVAREDGCRRAKVSVPLQPLGYDVAAFPGDFWSIAGDFCKKHWATEYASRLNENRLFGKDADARSYLKQYREHQEADWDMHFEVLYIARAIVSDNDLESHGSSPR